MISHYLRIAFRNMSRQKMYAAIKVGGFAIGIAACLLIGLLVRHELSYDSNYQDGNQIYRMIGIYNDNGKIEKGVSFPAPYAEALKDDYPEVEQVARVMPSALFYGAGSNQLRREDNPMNTFEEGFAYADQSLLDMLQLPMVYGNRNKALTEPNTMVITRSKADKYYPGQDPVGKIMFLNDNTQQSYKIGGVIEDWPTTSHLQYDYLLTLAGKSLWEGEQNNWMASNYTTYVKLKAGTDAKQFGEKSIKGTFTKYMLPAFKASGRSDAGELLGKLSMYVQPLRDIHLKSYDIYDWETRGDSRFVWMFVAVALFILLIACINFLNLSTARSANRAKEVGLRKVIGSQRSSLITQFLTESILYSVCAFVLGFVLAWAVLPLFNQMTGKELAIPFRAWWLAPLFVVGALFIGVLAGLYPSFYLSAFKPIQVLKGNLAKGSRNSGLRSTLVVFQFTTSIVLLIGTVVIYRQMQFILHSKIGFDKEQVVLLQGTGTLGQKVQTLKQELIKLPLVSNASVSGYLPTESKRDGNPFWKEGKTKEEASVGGQKWYVDESYIPTFGIKIAAGRNFSPQMPTDTQAAVINQSMVKKLNLAEPVGAKITNGWEHFTVIGVMEDFHFESMKKEIVPLCLTLGRGGDVVSVKLKPGNAEKAIADISAVWKSFAPNQPIRYSFLDDNFARMYKDVERTGFVFTSFAVLAIIIACLGLFALAAFMAEQRNKEISIRKVLGASVSGLFMMLVNNFLKLIILSFLIAIPLGWWLMNRWLQDYSYRISITWDVFLVAGVAILVIALLTICYQSIRAAIASPIKSLRSE
ncbi:ABC transporter permease [Paraflavitalea pollutisoli]|uniref:ABC transporter permease n=1 Tax=Paraflavitalea pollutisoli TaxID=3034143 RepID=UPI0023EADE26|nr:ABC transporter permease [Paraflavitalea sp. H1-2-19X]